MRARTRTRPHGLNAMRYSAGGASAALMSPMPAVSAVSTVVITAMSWPLPARNARLLICCLLWFGI